MYVCICKGIKEKDIHQAVKNGVSSMEELSNLTEISQECGCCETYVSEVLETAVSYCDQSTAS